MSIALIVLCLQDARGYLSSLRLAKTRSESLAAVSTATILIRKSKLKENDKLMEEIRQNPQHAISKFLLDGTRPEGILAPVDFYTSAFLRYDSVSVMPEYNKKTKTGFIAGMPPPEIMGGVLRDSGARAIVVSMVSLTFGLVSLACTHTNNALAQIPPRMLSGPSIRGHIFRRVRAPRARAEQGKKDDPSSHSHRLVRLCFF